MVTFEFLNLVLLSVYIMCTVRLGRKKKQVKKKQSQNLHAKPYATTLAKKSDFLAQNRKKKLSWARTALLY